MYLFHPFGINVVDKVFPFSKEWPIVQFALVSASTMLFASLSYWTYERFFLKLKEKFAARPKPLDVTPVLAVGETV